MPNHNPKVIAQMEVLVALADAIKSLKQIPNGELYARVMDKFTIESYNSYINALVNIKAIEIKNNMIIWKGL
jgi:hypothetical protein